MNRCPKKCELKCKHIINRLFTVINVQNLITFDEKASQAF
jgi:hypothetical protein